MFLFSFELLLPIVVIGLIVLAIMAFGSDRREPDPTGRRPYAAYLFSVAFVTLFVALSAGVSVVSSIVRIALPERNFAVEAYAYGESGVGFSQKVGPVPYPQPGQAVAPVPIAGSGQTVAPVPIAGSGQTVAPYPVPVAPGEEGPIPPNEALLQQYDPNKERIRAAVQAGLVAVAAGLVLLFHARRARELIQDPAFVEGPARRTYHVYLYAVCFVAVLTALVAAALAVYGLFRVIAPGTAGFGPQSVERDEGIHQLVTTGGLALAAVAIFHFHWKRVPGRAAPESEPPAAA